jgi:hypothetical protein
MVKKRNFGLAACAAFVLSGGAAFGSIVDNFNAGQIQAPEPTSSALMLGSLLAAAGWFAARARR